MSKASFISVLLFLFFFVACKKDSFIDVDAESSKVYMPMKLGSAWYFEVDSLIFRKTISGNEIDTALYQVKEVVADTFTNAANELVFVIDKYERKSASENWSIRTVYAAFFSQNRFLKTEENNTFIKFPLPPIRGLRWDGTAMINKTQLAEVGGESIEVFKDWESRIKLFNHTFNNGILDFSDCFTVEIADSESLIDLRSGFEVYSKNFGLIYRQLYVLDTQCDGNPANCKDKTWEEKAEKGFIVKQRLTAFQY